MKRFLLILCMSVSMAILLGQTTESIVMGDISDAQTGYPIPSASVYIEGTTYGTTSEEDGFFQLRAPLAKRATLVVSALGYYSERFKIKPGTKAGIEVVLRPRYMLLNTLDVLPGLNPALALVDSVQTYARINDHTPGYENGIDETAISLSHIRPKLLHHILEQARLGDQQLYDSLTFIPAYYLRYEGTDRVEEGALCLDSWVWDILFGREAYKYPYFYVDNVSIMNAQFVSPLSRSGRHYYQYAILDSVSDGGKAYTLGFRTKNPYLNTFNGTMLIDSATYAIRQVHADVPKEANVNFMRSYHIDMFFRPDEQGAYWPREIYQTRVMDAAIVADTSFLFPTLLVNKNITLAADYDMFSRDNIQRDTTMEVLRKLPFFRTVNFFATTILTGYIPTGTAVDIGRVPEILRVNPIETVRLGLPLRTNARMSRSVCLEAYAAYGFGDRAWKGSGTIHYALPTQRRHILSLGYTDAYANTDADEMTRLKRENSIWYQDRSLTTHWTEPFFEGKGSYNAMARRRHVHLHTEHDWMDGLEQLAYLSIGRQSEGPATKNYAFNQSFRFARLGTTLRLSWQEQKADLYFRRIHIYNHLPVLYLNAEAGSIHRDGRASYDMYGKLRLMLRQELPLGMAGRLDYLFEAGTMFGKAPDVFRYTFDGNQSYAFDPYAFNLMGYYEYSSRHYVSVHANWNGRGCLFDRIPGIRVLHLRELVSFKLGYGDGLSIPYLEMGIGIGNILRVGELHSVWRLTHRNDPNAIRWGMRFRLHIDT